MYLGRPLRHRPRLLPQPMGWRPRGLQIQRVSETSLHMPCIGKVQLTKVLGALCDHPAIDLPEPVASFDDLESIGDDLILGIGSDIL